VCTFYELKSPTMLNTVFRKTIFYKQVLELHRPFRFLCRHLGVEITGPYCTFQTGTRSSRVVRALLTANVKVATVLLSIPAEGYIYREMCSIFADRYEPKCGGGCWVLAKEYSCNTGAQINFGDLTTYLTYESQQPPTQGCHMKLC
jgi:hypothetical protein